MSGKKPCYVKPLYIPPSRLGKRRDDSLIYVMTARSEFVTDFFKKNAIGNRGHRNVETCESRFCCRDVRIARLYNQNRVTPGPRKKMKKNLDGTPEPAYKPSLVDGMEILPTMMKTEDEKET